MTNNKNFSLENKIALAIFWNISIYHMWWWNIHQRTAWMIYLLISLQPMVAKKKAKKAAPKKAAKKTAKKAAKKKAPAKKKK